MHAINFIQDLAVIMLVAGVVTILFHRLRQPVVLGYIVAGFIIGPHTPPVSLIHDEDTIKILAELGVIFLMFCLGLEFSLRKLFKVGATAFIAAFLEIALMIWIGYEIGQFFGWKTMDSLFLGAILAISSTTIIVKALNDLKMKNQHFAQLIFGVLIVEDILGIGIIALLSGIAVSGSVSSGEVFSTVGKLSLFMIVALVIGILLVPRLLSYVARFESNEMLLITVLGLCFGFCLLVVKLEYSMVLGAFLIGAIMAESRELLKIERLIEPVRDMFSAIFFVAIGLMIDPKILLEYAWPIAVITVAVVLGKMLSCGLGAFIAGNDGRTSLRVGMGLSQIGEFSFIIAALGMTLQVTSDFLYPVAVAVSAITTLLTPYLIRGADPLSLKLASIMPRRVARVFDMYGEWLRSIQPQGQSAVLAGMIRRILLQVGVNLALVMAIFFSGGYFAERLGGYMDEWVADVSHQKAWICGAALLLSLPFLIAAYRKLKALSMLLAEMCVKPEMAGRHTVRVRKVVAEVIPLLSLVVIFVMLAALSASILPANELLLVIALIAALVAALLWRWLIRVHTRMQIALLETLGNNQESSGH
ncbi:cation:proton antiporter [Pseudomonas ficuserectae]|uniref:Sodium/hydrogen exchanger family protein n=2 Tax=Pseudomonas amygdali pv. lachrymans TaxID=53707 RepID=A0AB37R5D0_PSEAV|nr:cation:proton antiporter [Pseudomonas amygdali]ARA83630.1 cation/H(+) antiporter [Pseudomonas amygdali pv. lachrymans]AXH58771.1 cation:proton antiporter [Pseudomonas amygdali pv. lachrymans str. M301315]KKY58155.1 potassium transporter [Pseudomonas amygdali pv. lachrymans]KPC03946.1 Sodium/hydrogen exchanger family protein [Pseudomonas amygdali pv. lachrymans]KPC18709.1 Sodium/hydrogen exchanger family protein [Pseudomonas amygdali pv. lachrymans]